MTEQGHFDKNQTGSAGFSHSMELEEVVWHYYGGRHILINDDKLNDEKQSIGPLDRSILLFMTLCNPIPFATR